MLSLRDGAIKALRAADLDEKVALTQELSRLWHGKYLSVLTPGDCKIADRPGRPNKPDLVPPRMLKKRSLVAVEGRIALMHALAHIELNAIDLALDIIARFAGQVAGQGIPRSFYDGWVMVAFEEAKHFSLLRARLEHLGSYYGALPAHDGLWQAAHDTRNDIYARLAVVPLILEARGLDVSPALLQKLRSLGDNETAEILNIIYEDEKGHVAVGAKWFRFFCARQGVDPAKRFQQLVRENFRGRLQPPFNDIALAQAGLTPTFYRSLSPLSHS